MDSQPVIQVPVSEGIALHLPITAAFDYLSMLIDQLTAILSLMCLDEFETRSVEIQTGAIWCAASLADQIRALLPHLPRHS